MSQKLQKMKEQIETLHLRRQIFKDIPTPQIIPIIRNLRQKQNRQNNLKYMKEQISKLQKSLSLSQQNLQRQQKGYEERQQMLKDQLLIHKAFMKNLATKYEETKKSYQDVQLTKTLIAAYRRCYLFRLAEIFLNDQARNLFKDISTSNGYKMNESNKFSVMSEAGSEQMTPTFLSYSMFVVYCISKIFNITLLNEFVFRGSKSYLLGAQKGEIVPLYRAIGKNMDGVIKMSLINISQVFDILGLDKKIKRHLNFREQIDLLSQFLILTDIDEISYKGSQ